MMNNFFHFIYRANKFNKKAVILILDYKKRKKKEKKNEKGKNYNRYLVNTISNIANKHFNKTKL